MTVDGYDEILSVGDESFRKKSGEALRKLIKSGVTTVYVLHSMNAIRNVCERVIWIDHGKIRAEGESEKVVEEYMRSF